VRRFGGRSRGDHGQYQCEGGGGLAKRKKRVEDENLFHDGRSGGKFGFSSERLRLK
jgi:hypothetical protein